MITFECLSDPYLAGELLIFFFHLDIVDLLVEIY